MALARTRPVQLIVSFLSIGLLCHASLYADIYVLTDLGDLRGGNGTSSAWAINESGQVAGFTERSGGLGHAFRWDSVNGMQDLGDLEGGGGQSFARSINSKGWVVGESSVVGSSDNRGFLWTESGMVDLGTLPGTSAVTGANDINDSDQVVGFSAGQAFVWESATGIRALETLPDVTLSNARGINNSGRVTGSIRTSAGTFAATWDLNTNEMQNLGDLPGGVDFSIGIDINEKGQIAGVGTTATGNHAFFWDSATGMHDIGDLPGGDGTDYTVAKGLNDVGQVVGIGGLNRGRGFIWDSVNGIRDLNSLLDPSAEGWIIGSAEGINNSGVIAAIASRNRRTHAVLLTPLAVPEPGAIGVLVAAVFGLSFRRVRSRRCTLRTAV